MGKNKSGFIHNHASLVVQVNVAEDTAKLFESITVESSTFQYLDFTIASLILENLATSEEIVADETIQKSFVESVNNLMSVNKEVVAKSEFNHGSTSRYG